MPPITSKAFTVEEMPEKCLICEGQGHNARIVAENTWEKGLL